MHTFQPQNSMARLITPNIFKQFPAVRAGMTLRGNLSLPRGLNFSHAVGDDPARVEENRRAVAVQLGFPPDRFIWQKQTHSSRVVRVAADYLPGESDALVTDLPGFLLAASIADCVPVLLYGGGAATAVAAVHSGWRGSAQNIVGKTISFMRREFGVLPADVSAWIGPSAGQCCYEVGNDVAGAFDSRHSRSLGEGKYLFDNRGAVLAQVLEAGVPPSGVEVDIRCTICDERFHSYRRDRHHSGRMVAMIGLSEQRERE